MHRAANQHCEETSVAKQSLVADIYACSECAKVFPSWQQMRLHEFKIHGMKRDARRFIGALNSCPACMRRYGSRTQAVRHLYHSKKCALYEWYFDELPEEEVDQLDSDETVRLHTRTHAHTSHAHTFSPTLQLSNPRLRI